MFGLFLFLLHPPRSWNAVRHACLFCQAVCSQGLSMWHRLLRARTPQLCWTHHVGQGACGVRLGGPRFNPVISGFFFFFNLPCEKIACDSRGEDGAVQHVSSHSSQQRGSTPVHPVKPCELDTCPDIMSSQIWQYEGTTKPV